MEPDNNEKEELYFYIKEKGPMGRSAIGVFVAAKGICAGKLMELINEGYVIEKNGLYAVTGKEFD